MSLTFDFDRLAGAKPTSHIPETSDKPKGKRLPPFSLRLSEEERARLLEEANGAPLGTYIKAKLLEPSRARRSGVGVEVRHALARALALLGRAELSNSLVELARAASIGVLPFTPETEAQLDSALVDVRAIRVLLMRSLGLKSEGAP